MFYTCARDEFREKKYVLYVCEGRRRAWGCLETAGIDFEKNVKMCLKVKTLYTQAARKSDSSIYFC